MEGLLSHLHDYPALAVLVTGLGFLSLGSFAYNILSFVLLYLRPSNVGRYLHTTNGKPAWALITGASDGIGKWLAYELAAKGFNVVLHGRNPAKLDAVHDELIKAFPGRSFRTLVVDASAAPCTNCLSSQRHGRSAWKDYRDVDIDAIVASISDLNITVLINNAGGSPSNPIYSTLGEMQPDVILSNISLNSLFPILLLNKTLPLLEKNAPSLVMNMGSLSDNGLPYLPSYGASKAFMMQLSSVLAREAAIEGTGVDVMGMRVGYTIGATHNKDEKATVFNPHARVMARAALARVGCGRAQVIGYVGHGLQQAFVNMLPERLRESFLGDVMVKLRKEDRMKMKGS